MTITELPILTKITRADKPSYNGEDLDIVAHADILRRELMNLHNRFDQATSPVLIDSIIHEIQAVELRYTYYLSLCKERGIVSGGV